MMTLVDANLLPLILALLVGLLIGWWMFARRRGAAENEPGQDRILQARELETPGTQGAERSRPIRDGVDTREGHGLADQGAAATADVAGQVLGVRAHAELPGASGPPDDLQMLKGVGPKLAQRLNENGIIRFDQLASLSENEIAMLDERMGPFRGRIARDRIVEQAAYLARGDRDGFEAKFGKLGSGA
jgi:predicted flap endonuclease-1-like 5' DNA nuclease